VKQGCFGEPCGTCHQDATALCGLCDGHYCDACIGKHYNAHAGKPITDSPLLRALDRLIAASRSMHRFLASEGACVCRHDNECDFCSAITAAEAARAQEIAR